MDWYNVRFCAVLEVTVMLLQVFGVAALCLNRFLPTSRWAGRGQVGAILALIGLAIAGALCNRHCSEFALFAGGTMTVLLIGMTTGNHHGHHDHSGEHVNLIHPEPNLAS
jgi:hypothetical protein